METTSAIPPDPKSDEQQPDIMNDSAYDPIQESEHRRPEDSDTCRICRGEGSVDEPLFYPCKCSGSIKFVHQDCLMEWLQHSQKKHCELCKTPFRFTKLYHPQMPKVVPTGIFIQKALWHIVAHLLIWVRLTLVALVWLVIVPWCMRSAWSLFFWLADAGWARDRMGSASELGVPSGTPPDKVSNTAAASSPTSSTPSSLRIISQTLNFTSTDPFLRRAFKAFYHSLTQPFRFIEIPHVFNSSHNDTNDTQRLLHQALQQRRNEQTSVLSSVPFFLDLTASPAINRLVIHVLEGILITVGVVVVLILVFLIREWVVQQLPVIDVGAAVDMQNALAEVGGQAQDAEDAGIREDTLEHEVHHEMDADDETEDHDALMHHGEHSDGDESIRAEGSANDALGTAHFTQADREEAIASTEVLIDLGINLPDEAHMEDLIDLQQGDHLEEHQSSASVARQASTQFRHHNPASGENDIVTGSNVVDAEERGRSGPELADHTQRDRRPSSTRPNMPVRERSFIAAAIHRNMEESQSSSAALEPTESDRHRTQQSTATTGDDYLQSLRDDRADSPDSSSIFGTDNGSDRFAAFDDSEGPVNNRQQLVQLEALPLPPSPAAGDEPVDPLLQLDAEPRGVRGRIAHWIWGDLEQTTQHVQAEEVDQDDDHIVEDLADEEPFVPFVDAHPVHQDHDHPEAAEIRDPEVEAAAAEAGIELDQDAADDAEDLEGVLELIGVQGPVVGLFQNALFSSILIITSIVLTVFLPYLWGKIVLLCCAYPALFIQIPLFLVVQFVNIVLDILITISCGSAYIVIQFYRLLTQTNLLADTAEWTKNMVATTAPKVIRFLTLPETIATSNELLDFSIESHDALVRMKDLVTTTIGASDSFILSFVEIASSDGIWTALKGTLSSLAAVLPELLHTGYDESYRFVKSAVSWNTLTYLLSAPQGKSEKLSPLLAYWSSLDRGLAIVAGYSCVAILGAIYLANLAPLTSDPPWRQVENSIIHFLQQAGGVLKVIFIISIEMIAFPLFCGFLLDFALLPLFENASTMSRVAMTISSPWTSGFVHWFVGTCYMFHFALFVSMCRKIMRTGVLYFIRDPDDPTFHPVRDVLERSVAVQLRKIAFSAIVYGALIMICLGGVVWGLWYSSDAVLPIHWSSSESALEFPLDILFYSFLTPVLLRIVRPTDGLHAMYKIWFHKCARFLRLSDFLFRSPHKDEEGYHVRRTWKAWLLRKKGDVDNPIPAGEQPEDPIVEAYFVRNGRRVRAPDSDQVRVPKGNRVFIEVNDKNERLDGRPEVEGSVQSRDSPLVAVVYIPPLFRIRVGLFVLAVWLFAAATGVLLTIVPLLFGRHAIASLGVARSEINDIYAFSLGFYVLGALCWMLFKTPGLVRYLRTRASLAPSGAALLNILRAFTARTSQVLSLIYVYGLLSLVLPFLFSSLIELYVLLPVHVFFAPTNTHRHHIVHLVQDWTLGILYVRIITRILVWQGDAVAAAAGQGQQAGEQRNASLASRALHAIVKDGYTRPNARLATRYFILPTALLYAALAGIPFALATLLNRTLLATADAATQTRAVRLAYPAALAVFVLLWLQGILKRAGGRWKNVVKDEVYLIGERLHNFGERKGQTGHGHIHGGRAGEQVEA